MIIHSYLHDYMVNIEDDFSFIATLPVDENSLIVIDKNVHTLYYDKLFSGIPEERILIIEALETNKVIDTALLICERMTALPGKRNATLISFGGGIIQDITGFAANILYRGINWIFIPTTLLASADSSIGSKTSLNYKHYKNLLGTFFPPKEIFICPRFFHTLSDKDYFSGLGEVVKFNIMAGMEGLDNVEKDIELLLNREEDCVNAYVRKSLEFKKSFIEKDEFDRKERVLLNFAHTFGHAFETVSNYFIPHGTAVAMGMIVANRISFRRGYLDQDIVSRSERVLKRIIAKEFGTYQFDIDNLIGSIRKDKKQTSKNLTAILLYGNMDLQIYNDLVSDEIISAMKELHELFI